MIRLPQYIFAVLVSVCIAIPLQAQPTQWSSVGVGGGGALFNPSFNPYSPGALYVACDMSQLFHSTDYGVNWRTMDFRQVGGGNAAGRVEYTDVPSILYVINQRGDATVPSKSTDGGQTWNALPGDPTGGGAISLFADPGNSQRVIVSDYTTVYISTDGGAVFQPVVTYNVNGNGCHVAGAYFDGNFIAIGTIAGMLLSANGGASFSPAPVSGIPASEAMVSMTAAKSVSALRFYCVTTDKLGLYAGTTGANFQQYRGVYVLDFGAISWQARTNGIGPGKYPFFIAAARNAPGVAYAAGGSDTNVPVVWKTTDAGLSWFEVFLTNGNQNIRTGWSGDGGDRGWSYGEYALGLAVSAVDPNIAAITDLGFLHLTTNGGGEWRQTYVSPQDENPSGNSTPRGKSYHTSGLENTSCWHVLWADSSTLIGSYTDIRGTRSVDGGSAWSFDYSGHAFNTMYHALSHPSNGFTYAAVSSVHDLYQSTYLVDSRIDVGTGQVLFSGDKGHTWMILHDFQHPVIWLALDPANPNRMYASVVHSTAGGIYVTNNLQSGAASIWTRLASPPRTQGHPFVIRVLDDGTVVCSYSGRRTGNPLAFTASSGVFMSTNGGVSWLDRSDPGMLYWTKDVVIDPHDPAQMTWYAGVFSGWGGPPNGLGGLYRTTDRGATWSKILPLDRVESCTSSPVNRNEMYVTTEVDGLWHTLNLYGSNPLFGLVASYPFRHPLRVFYTPTNAGEVWVTSFGNGLRKGNAPITPVELEAFTATVSDRTVALRWSTAGEQNNEGFTVERLAEADGDRRVEPSRGWQAVGFVAGHGTSTVGRQYSIADTPPWTASTYWYRLRQQDYDGSIEYSSAVAVSIAGPGDFSLSSPYPNPANGETRFEVVLPRAATVRAEIIDALGRLVYAGQDAVLERGAHTLRLPVGTLRPGAYVCRIVAGGVVMVRAVSISR